MIEKPWDTLKRLRKEKGWTQQQLGCGIVSQSMVCHIESGRVFPADETLVLLAKRLLVDADKMIADWRIYKTRQMVRNLLWGAFLAEDEDKVYDLINLYVGILTEFENLIYLGWLTARDSSIQQAERTIDAAWRYGQKNRSLTHLEYGRMLVVEAKAHERIYQKANRYLAATWWSHEVTCRLSNLS